MTGPATFRYQRSDDGGPGFCREFELQQVIADIGRRLATIARIRTREHDDLDVIEAAAAPYALALYYEVRRLETLLRRERFLRRARRTLTLGGSRRRRANLGVRAV
jgi:hypothetical protein